MRVAAMVDAVTGSGGGREVRARDGERVLAPTSLCKGNRKRDAVMQRLR